VARKDVARLFPSQTKILEGGTKASPPNEDFGSRSMLQGREYSILGQDPLKRPSKKRALHLLFLLPKSSFGTQWDSDYGSIIFRINRPFLFPRGDHRSIAASSTYEDSLRKSIRGDDIATEATFWHSTPRWLYRRVYLRLVSTCTRRSLVVA
jgi:hypothetical protein